MSQPFFAHQHILEKTHKATSMRKTTGATGACTPHLLHLEKTGCVLGMRARARPVPSGARGAPLRARPPLPAAAHRPARLNPALPAASARPGPQPGLCRLNARDRGAPGKAEAARHQPEPARATSRAPWLDSVLRRFLSLPSGPGAPSGQQERERRRFFSLEDFLPGMAAPRARRAHTALRHARAASGGTRGQRPLAATRCGLRRDRAPSLRETRC